MPLAETAAAETPAASHWRPRAALIIADLIAFDRSRLGWVLAIRTMIGLLLPLLLARAFDMPALVWVGLGAFLLAIGDCIDDGDRLQALRLVFGGLLGSLALATGVLAGGNLTLAILGMLFWGVLTGLLGVYGNAFATMSLPIAWAYVELGLPDPTHTLSDALSRGALFAVGGGLNVLLTFGLRIGGPYAPLRARTAAVYQALASYLAASPTGSAISPETQVRAALAEARRVALEVRRHAQGASTDLQRQLVLIEIGDRLFSLLGAFKEEERQPPLQVMKAIAALGTSLRSREPPATLAVIRSELGPERHAPSEVLSTRKLDPAVLDQRLRQETSNALLVALGDEVPRGELAEPMLATWFAAIAVPLLAVLDRNSIVARHALRFALVAAMAVVVFWVFPKPFGYWVPLTVTVVLKPYAGMTLSRTVQRVAGTMLGILAGVVLMPLLPTETSRFLFFAIAFFWMMAVLPFNYSLAILFLSAGLVPFEHVLNPGLGENIGLLRLAATLVGAFLAFFGGHLLWPSFERRVLPALLRASISSMQAYAHGVLRAANGDAVDPADVAQARRHAGMDITNLQATLQHAMTELGGKPRMIEAVLRASTALQRMMMTFNALMNAAPALAGDSPGLTSFAGVYVRALERLAAGTTTPALDEIRTAMPALQDTPASTLVRRELERATSEFEMLRDALGAAKGSRET